MSTLKGTQFLQLVIFYNILTAAGQTDSQWPSEKLFAAVGSSILLPGLSKVDFKNVEHVKWMFSETRILDYYSATKIPTFTNLYKSRATFFSSNGSLLLKDLARSDSGLYKMQINLNVTRVFQLSALVALSEPLISNNSTDLGTTIALVCWVIAGIPDSFVWWKDSTVIANGEHYQLLQGNSTLVITAALKSDCGDYVCMVENAVSRKNVSHRLPIYGLPHLIHYTMVLSIIALVFAVLVFFGIMFLCFCLDTERVEITFHGKALRRLHVASMLSLITLLAAFICWIWFEGYCEITIFMVVLLCVLQILSIFSTCSMVTWDSKRFNKILRSRICRVTVDAVTPICGLVVVCASAILLAEIAKQAGKGCEPPPELLSSILPAVFVPVVLCGAFFALYVYRYRKQRRAQRLKGSAAETSKENPDQPVRPEQVPLQAVPDENGLNTRNCEEEPLQT